MKHIYLTLIIFIFTGISFSQQITSYDYNKQQNENKPAIMNTASSMEFDVNNDGSVEIFKGIMLKPINKNTFWVKNAQILTSDKKVLVDLSRTLLVNNISLIGQVSAVYGYIVEFSDKGNKDIIIAIANAKGEKDSDDLVINLDDIK